MHFTQIFQEDSIFNRKWFFSYRKCFWSCFLIACEIASRNCFEQLMILIQVNVFMTLYEKQKWNMHSKKQRLVLVFVILFAVILIPSFTTANQFVCVCSAWRLVKTLPFILPFPTWGFQICLLLCCHVGFLWMKNTQVQNRESQILFQRCSTYLLQWICWRNLPQLFAFHYTGGGMHHVHTKSCRKGSRQDLLKFISTFI